MDSSFDHMELVVDLLSIFLVLFDEFENFILLLLDGLEFINVSLLYGVVSSGLHSLINLLNFIWNISIADLYSSRLMV